MDSAIESSVQIRYPTGNPNLAEDGHWSPHSPYPLESSSPLPPSYINFIDSNVPSDFLSPIGVSETDRGSAYQFTPSPQMHSFQKAEDPEAEMGGSSSYIVGHCNVHTSTAPSSLSATLTSTSLSSAPARHPSISQLFLPSPLTTAVTVGEGRSSIKKTQHNTAPLSPAAFDLTMLERSAEFLCCLFMSLMPSTSPSLVVDEEDADIIRNHLTNLLGKQVCFSLSIQLLPDGIMLIIS